MAYESLPIQGNVRVTDTTVLVTQNFGTVIDQSDDEADRFDPLVKNGDISVSANVPFGTFGDPVRRMFPPAADQNNYDGYGYGIGSADGLTVIVLTVIL